MDDKNSFKDQNGDAEPSTPLFSIFRPKPAPAHAPKPVPQPQKIVPPEPGLKERVEQLAGELSALASRCAASEKAALSREETGKLLDSLRREAASAAGPGAEALRKLEKRLEGLEKLQDRAADLEKIKKRIKDLESRIAAPANDDLAELLEKLAQKTAAISARLAAAEGGITAAEAAKLVEPLSRGLAAADSARAGEMQKTSGRINELEQKLSEVAGRPPSRLDACLGIRIEELAAQLAVLSARVDAASWARAEEFQAALKRIEELERAQSAAPNAALAERAEELSGRVSAVVAAIDAAAWSRTQEAQQYAERLGALERAIAKLSAQYSRLGLEGRLDKVAADITALYARLDAASWARAEEFQRSQKRVEELEREVAKLAAKLGKKE